MKKIILDQYKPSGFRRISRVAGIKLLLCLLCLVVSGPLLAQSARVNLNLQDQPLSRLFDQIKSQTGYKVFFSEDNVNMSQRVSVVQRNVAVSRVLDELLPKLNLKYEFVEDTIVLSPAAQRASVTPGITTDVKYQVWVPILGRVTDMNGQPLIGVGIVLRSDITRGTVTDQEGKFSITAPENEKEIQVSMLGMKSKVVVLSKGTFHEIRLEEDNLDIQNVVITGFAPKAKNSFTGTATQVTGEDLRSMNPSNMMSALQIFDPSFRVMDVNGIFGSNPNYIPELIQVRGQNSMPDISEGTLQTYTSLPVFMVDGFQRDVQYVYDMDINRIESVTILKDAAAASIYGSRAANGVIVIQTRAPESGELRITYNMTSSLQAPDLSSYNLMNAPQLLEYMVKAKRFANGDYEESVGNPSKYNTYMLLKKEIDNGVDTYWLSEPLRTAFSHSHSIDLEGGIRLGQENQRRSFEYMVNLRAAPSRGVMKGSDRDRYSAGVTLAYKSRTLNITNSIEAALIDAKDSPYGSFQQYTTLFPFYRMTDENGKYLPVLSTSNIPKFDGFPEGNAYTGTVITDQLNPLYEGAYTNSFNKTETTQLSYQFGLNWEIIRDLRLRASFGVSKNHTQNDVYSSPLSELFSDYLNIPGGTTSASGFDIDKLYKRGKYTINYSETMAYSGGVYLSYGKEIGKHYLQGVLGGELKDDTNVLDSYALAGYLSDTQGFPANAIAYYPNGSPGGGSSTVRLAGSYATLNYSYDNRYMADVNFRLDGSSNFAKNQRTAPFWTAGLRWNISNEKFVKNTGIFDSFALKANIGTLGSTNFALSNIVNLYRFVQSYDGVMGAELISISNPDLKWQTTLSKNLGVEIRMLKGMIDVEFNLYDKLTENNLTDISLLPSTGFSTYKANMGNVENKGYEFMVKVNPIRTKDLRLSLFVRGAHNKGKVTEISDALKKYNEQVTQNQGNSTGSQIDNVYLFEEGTSLTAIWAVPSLGIDPATGKEIFVTKDGKKTFLWNAADQVVVGDTEPTLSGSFGFNLFWKNWSLSSSFMYSFGGDLYNTTLYSKMEGKGTENSNLDKRALYDKWLQPGDVAKYKGYTDTNGRQPTSRFVQRNNYLTMSSVNLAYTLRDPQFLGLSSLKLELSTNDLFYASSILQERGYSYPFARTFNFTLRANF